MNTAIEALFYEYLRVTGDDKPTAALLTLADMLTREPPEPMIVEPEDCCSYTAKEAAGRLNLSSRQVYQMCLAGELRCYRAGRSIRIPIDEIARFESESPRSPTRFR